MKLTEPDFCNTPSVKSPFSKLRFKKTILARTPDRNHAPLAKNVRPAEGKTPILNGQKSGKNSMEMARARFLQHPYRKNDSFGEGLKYAIIIDTFRPRLDFDHFSHSRSRGVQKMKRGIEFI